jgi:hypothetical protein
MYFFIIFDYPPHPGITRSKELYAKRGAGLKDKENSVIIPRNAALRSLDESSNDQYEPVGANLKWQSRWMHKKNEEAKE